MTGLTIGPNDASWKHIQRRGRSAVRRDTRETVKEIVVPVYLQTEATAPTSPREMKLLFAERSDDELLGYGVPAEWLSDVGLQPRTVCWFWPITRPSACVWFCRDQADRLLSPVVTDMDGYSDDRTGTVSVFNGPPPIIQSFKTEDDEIAAVSTWIAANVKIGVAPHDWRRTPGAEAIIARAFALSAVGP